MPTLCVWCGDTGAELVGLTVQTALLIRSLFWNASFLLKSEKIPKTKISERTLVMVFLFYSSTCLPSSGAGEWTSWISSALFNYVKPIYVKTNHFSCNEYLLQIYATFPCSVCMNQAKHRFTRIRIRLLWHSRVGCTLEVAWRKRCAVGWLVKRALNGDAT